MKTFFTFLEEHIIIKELFTDKDVGLPTEHAYQETYGNKKDITADIFHVSFPDHVDKGIIEISKRPGSEPGVAAVNFTMPGSRYGVPSHIKKTFDKAYQKHYKSLGTISPPYPPGDKRHEIARRMALKDTTAVHGEGAVEPWISPEEDQVVSKRDESAKHHTFAMFNAVSRTLKQYVKDNPDIKNIKFTATDDNSKHKLYRKFTMRNRGYMTFNRNYEPVFNIPVNDHAKNHNVQENFLDGKNPEDKGDMARHGLKGKSINQLKAIRSSKTASPRQKQLAHWFINMHHQDNPS